jgi:hypothetical protein
MAIQPPIDPATTSASKILELLVHVVEPGAVVAALLRVAVGICEFASADVTDRVEGVDAVPRAQGAMIEDQTKPPTAAGWVITSGGAAGSPDAMTWVSP